MIIFIDDSGDPGFKITKGSSKTFVICCVVFDDELEAEKTAVKIKELRRELKKSDRFEFKFNKSSREFRLRFLKAVSSSKFRVRAIVMPKEDIYSDLLKHSKESFYNFTIKLVLEYNFGTIKNAKIRIDGSGDRLFRRNLLTYLRKNLNSKEGKIISNLRFRDSKQDVLIQLADMIAGSIGRSFDAEKSDSKIYIDTVKKRIEDMWIFGSNKKRSTS